MNVIGIDGSSTKRHGLQIKDDSATESLWREEIV
jgi:hypothetical protein